jgi:hypothetical protein
VTNFIAVEALNHRTVSVLLLVLRAGFGDMTELVAVGALGNATINRFTSVLQAFHILLWSLGPKILLFGSSVSTGLTPRSGVFLVEIALKIHVCVGWRKLLLEGNDVQVQLLVTKSLLEVNVGSIWGSLNVLLYGFLHVIEITLGRCSNQLSPGLLGRDICNIGTLELSRVLTGNSAVS